MKFSGKMCHNFKSHKNQGFTSNLENTVLKTSQWESNSTPVVLGLMDKEWKIQIWSTSEGSRLQKNFKK